MSLAAYGKAWEVNASPFPVEHGESDSLFQITPFESQDSEVLNYHCLHLTVLATDILGIILKKDTTLVPLALQRHL
ncbi:hypothetical protein DTO169E5_4078 [Paecilomyces variotii]|nr:hypothetical protein DTO169E5_4078 [Paecilomyces variotii]KAJ9408616.1 hypothetical protein DTO045G8_3564 [Paecilomyces variotii]